MYSSSRHSGFIHPQSSEITPLAVYQDRRNLLRLMASGAAGASLATWAGREALAAGVEHTGKLLALPGTKSSVAGASFVSELI